MQNITGCLADETGSEIEPISSTYKNVNELLDLPLCFQDCCLKRNVSSETRHSVGLFESASPHSDSLTCNLFRCAAFQMPGYELHAGYLEKGDNVNDIVEHMTPAEAKQHCQELDGCVGFTYEGTSTQTSSTRVFFKNKWSFFESEDWTSVHKGLSLG